LATQNTHESAIYIWDLYNKRATKGLEDQSVDISDCTLNFSDDISVYNFRWFKNSPHLHCSTSTGDSSDSTYFSIFMIDQIENSYKATLEFDENCEQSMRCDSDDSNYKISFKSSDKFHSFIKVPFKMKNFCLSDKNKNLIFGTNPKSKFMMDFNSPKDIKHFKMDSEISSSPYGDFEVNYNNKNLVIFSGQKMIQLYDIRKVALQGEGGADEDRPPQRRDQNRL
jgi:hypothetical protein